MSRLPAYAWVAVTLVLTQVGASALGAPLAPDFRVRYGFATYGYSSSMRFSNASGLFYDTKRGELYVADTGNGQVAIFDNKGMPVAKFRHDVQNDSADQRRQGEPRSVVVARNGDILVTDNLCNYLDVLDFQGRSVQKLWPADLLKQPTSKLHPGCLAVDPSGNILVSVAGEGNSILVLTPDYKLKAEIARVAGTVTGLWTDKDGRIYATYGQGDCVRVYSPDGKVLVKFGVHDLGPGNFALPSGLVTDGDGNLWVVDMLRNEVQVFKQSGAGSELKYSFSQIALAGFATPKGHPGYPSAIAGDGANRIFVLEKTGARLQGYEVVFGERSDRKK